VISKNFNVPDILRITMGLELPGWLLTEGRVVYQYIQLLGEDMDSEYGHISVGCQVTVGEENSGKVENFEGTANMKDSQGLVSEINYAEK
jgi:hypothetical protein